MSEPLMVALNVMVLGELAPARHALVDRVRDHGAQELEGHRRHRWRAKCSPRRAIPQSASPPKSCEDPARQVSGQYGQHGSAAGSRRPEARWRRERRHRPRPFAHDGSPGPCASAGHFSITAYIAILRQASRPLNRVVTVRANHASRISRPKR
jgi:hypothetical protein